MKRQHSQTVCVLYWFTVAFSMMQYTWFHVSSEWLGIDVDQSEVYWSLVSLTEDGGPHTGDNQLCIDGVGLRTLWDTDDLKEKDGIILYFHISNQSLLLEHVAYLCQNLRQLAEASGLNSYMLSKNSHFEYQSALRHNQDQLLSLFVSSLKTTWHTMSNRTNCTLTRPSFVKICLNQSLYCNMNTYCLCCWFLCAIDFLHIKNTTMMVSITHCIVTCRLMYYHEQWHCYLLSWCWKITTAPIVSSTMAA